VSEPTFVEIPVERLTREVLDSLVQEFVTRDGTDYGAVERSVEEKTAQVLRQLSSGEAVVTFDTETQDANIVLVRDLANSTEAEERP